LKRSGIDAVTLKEKVYKAYEEALDDKVHKLGA